MDRNASRLTDMSDAWQSLSARRAWIEISGGVSARLLVAWSLSARRAWIEMDWASVISAMTSVALRKESVDRNLSAMGYTPKQKRSLSARRAWIEISVAFVFGFGAKVALRKESVDRNIELSFWGAGGAGRSPQGERG